MHFLTPIWLTAIAAVLIPVVIHLWNIKQGKTLKVGSIALMGEASRQSSRSFRLLDLLLLALRCLILIVLAALLAMPFWTKPADGKVKGWVLIPKQSFKEAYKIYKKPVDSLTAAGYEFHYFDKGFAKAEWMDVVKDTAKVTDTTITNYWDLLSQLNGKVPSKLPVSLFTENTLTHFSGSKPMVALNLNWQTYTPGDFDSEWLEKAWIANDDNIKVLKGTSNERGTAYSVLTMQPGSGFGMVNTLIVRGGDVVAHLKSDPERVVTADTSVLRIAMIADAGQPDAAYLNAALKAIAPMLHAKVQLLNYNDVIRLKQKQDWMFWLARRPVIKAATDIAKNLFIYQTGKAQNVATWMSVGDGFDIGRQDGQVPLHLLITSPKSDAGLVWRDGYGHAVLSAEKDKDFTLYRFYTRFDPQWGDLVWNDNFPRMLLGLMTDHEPSAISIRNDKRVMDVAQIMPLMAKTNEANLSGLSDEVDLSRYIWMVLVLVFLTERWLAHRKTILANG
ncbi:BatA domain-containing protein [uncultured Mucilaginibacter sp.]|uniref:BatA domain-containing protein n=1 Tax=uncultured Mucilaginibacter sp. TaxID=797541 RepID=UPI0025E763BC|nr:BatA domain-containing protein [uncultured Mucilaginibacter sp.]